MITEILGGQPAAGENFFNLWYKNLIFLNSIYGVKFKF